MKENGSKTAVPSLEGDTKLTPEDITRLFEDGYREIEVLANGMVRERPKSADASDETVTRSLKTGRTWY